LITLALLLACFTPATTPFDWSIQKFENDYTGDVDTLVLQPFEFDDLLCPDGEPATFYAVYDTAVTTPMPIVVVFHSGSFDYVQSPQAVDPLYGNHFAGENRLTAEWAADKVFETFGLLPGEQVDPTEVNDGTLPAALALQGAFAIYPTNCWGDLWHNDSSVHASDYTTDGFRREGGFMAWAMTRFASTDATVSADWRGRYGLDDLAVTLDSGGIYYVGLGEGGRAIPELFWRSDTAPPIVKGALLDSSCDDLSYYVTNATANAAYYAGLQRIFSAEDLTALGGYSLATYYNTRTVGGTTQAYWSSGDPQVPDECNSRLNALNQQVENLQVTNYQLQTHVFLNSDLTNAQNAVSKLLAGQL
jgi:hypothetical protein